MTRLLVHPLNPTYKTNIPIAIQEVHLQYIVNNLAWSQAWLLLETPETRLRWNFVAVANVTCFNVAWQLVA